MPKCGFEWNMNDILLNVNPLSTLIGILELLVTISLGAQLVINYDRQLWTNSADYFVQLVNEHRITACILHSFYLMELYKGQAGLTNCSLKNILYIHLPLHPNFIHTFKKQFNIINCRFIFCNLNLV